MKAIILLALGCLVLVSAQRKFYQTPHLMPAEASGLAGEHLRSLNKLRDHMGLSEEFSFKVESSRKSSSGVERVRLRQLYNGVPIRMATLQASKSRNGFYTGAVSGFCPTIPSGFNTHASKSKRKVKKALVKYLNANDNEIPGSKVQVSELRNFNYEKQIHVDESGTPVLVYFASALVERGLDDGAYIRYPRVLFRAGNLQPILGAFLVKRDRKCKNNKKKACPRATGGNRNHGAIPYGPRCNQICLNAAVKRDNLCVLENNFIKVKTLDNSWKRENAKLVSFKCDERLEDKSNGAFSPAADAFYYAQVFYDVLENWGRLDRTNREPHTLYVHFGSYYPNSFWDGQSTTFGDGGDRTFAFATGEVIGHEMCHALTESFGNLVFDNEAESINEAFSDICGKAITTYLEGEGSGWEFAKDLLRNKDKALRYFDDPTRDGSTIAHLSKYEPSMDAYVGMGIYLKAFYNIVATQGVRFRDAFETFLFANQIYWNEETSFVDGACGVLKAATDLGLDGGAFSDAFSQVGIDLGFCNLAGTVDHIISDGERREADISSSRKARYAVHGSDKIRVTITGAGDNTVTMESHCTSGNYEMSNARSTVFIVSGGSIISLVANSEDLINVKVRFDFE